MQPDSPKLAANNYRSVMVVLRGEEHDPISMKVNPGIRLMDYLTSGKASSHIQIADEQGRELVVKVTDILRVEPLKKLPEVSDYV